MNLCQAEDKDNCVPAFQVLPHLFLAFIHLPGRAALDFLCHLSTPDTPAPSVAHKNTPPQGFWLLSPQLRKLLDLQSSQVTPPTDTGKGTRGLFFPRLPSRPQASPHGCLSRLPEQEAIHRREGEATKVSRKTRLLLPLKVCVPRLWHITREGLSSARPGYGYEARFLERHFLF